MRLQLVAYLLFATVSPPLAAQAALSRGEQLAKESINLIRFAEISNLGAADPECKQAGFKTYDVNKLIDGEIAAAFRRLAAADSKPSVEVEQILGTLRQVQTQIVDGQPAAPRTYALLKQKAIGEAGAENACKAMASRFLSVVSDTKMRIQALPTRTTPTK